MFFDKRGNNKIPPPPYKVPYIHPRNYYQTGQVDTTAESTEKASILNQLIKLVILNQLKKSVDPT